MKTRIDLSHTAKLQDDIYKRLNPEGRILDAISMAKRNMQNIISINIPTLEQGALLDKMIQSTGAEPLPYLKIESIYGIPVRKGKKLSITLEI